MYEAEDLRADSLTEATVAEWLSSQGKGIRHSLMLQTPSLHKDWLQVCVLHSESRGDGRNKRHEIFLVETRKTLLLLDTACAVSPLENG